MKHWLILKDDDCDVAFIAEIVCVSNASQFLKGMAI